MYIFIEAEFLANQNAVVISAYQGPTSAYPQILVERFFASPYDPDIKNRIKEIEKFFNCITKAFVSVGYSTMGIYPTEEGIEETINTFARESVYIL